MAQNTKAKGDPIPVRFDKEGEGDLRFLSDKTGLSLGEILRRATKFALPKFMSGEVNILTLEPAKGGKTK